MNQQGKTEPQSKRGKKKGKKPQKQPWLWEQSLGGGGTSVGVGLRVGQDLGGWEADIQVWGRASA